MDDNEIVEKIRAICEEKGMPKSAIKNVLLGAIELLEAEEKEEQSRGENVNIDGKNGGN